MARYYEKRNLTEEIVAIARGMETSRMRVERLGQYNAEVARGIMHTPEWRTFMLAEQDWFNTEYQHGRT